jgi:heme-degrading monooxygenase HmoA
VQRNANGASFLGALGQSNLRPLRYHGEMPFVSITRLRLRSWRFLPMFAWRALRSSRQARRAEGNLASKLLGDRRNTFWTSTLWSSEAAMKKFMTSGSHMKAMRNLAEWCDEAAVVHWTQETAELPTWREAYLRLKNEGRRSKVNHPSAGHRTYEFPEPKA